MSTDNLYLQQILLQLRANGGGGGGGTPPADIASGIDGSNRIELIEQFLNLLTSGESASQSVTSGLANSIEIQTLLQTLSDIQAAQLTASQVQTAIETASNLAQFQLLLAEIRDATQALNPGAATSVPWDSCIHRVIAPGSPEFSQPNPRQIEIAAPIGTEMQILSVAIDYQTGATGQTGVAIRALNNDYALSMTPTQANSVTKGYVFGLTAGTTLQVNGVIQIPFPYWPIQIGYAGTSNANNRKLRIEQQVLFGSSADTAAVITLGAAVVRSRLIAEP